MKWTRILSIAGSDSGGGAGIQADLKTFSALGCYGMTVVTAITAQNTSQVTAIHNVPTAIIEKQIEAILEDIGTDAIKIGMLSTVEAIKTIAGILKQFEIPKIVLDPVMVAKSGDRLLQNEAISALKEELVPIATLITPNIPEAEALTNMKIRTKEDVQTAALTLSSKVPAVLIKGGHQNDSSHSSDYLFWRGEGYWLTEKRVNTLNTHGTGCTLSSAIACFLGKGMDLFSSVESAKKYLSKAILRAAHIRLGRGHGPVHHFWNTWREDS